MDDRDLTPQDLALLRRVDGEHRSRYALGVVALLGMLVCFGLAGLGIRDMHAEATDLGRHPDVLSGTRALNRRMEGLLMRTPDVLMWVAMGALCAFGVGDTRSRRRDALLLKLAGRRIDSLR